MTSTAGRVVFLLALALPYAALAPVSARAQAAAPSAVARAAALRDSGELPAAARLLEDELQRTPHAVAALRMLAQTLYWMRRADDALARYDAALALAPDDVALRLEYGRTLVELRRAAQARPILLPLLEQNHAEATFLLGLDQYWRGDFTAARGSFLRTLAGDPTHAEAARLLDEIRGASAPWLRVEPQGQHDSQQLDRAGVEAEAGVFLTPLHSLGADVAARRYSWADSTAAVSVARVSTRRHFPRARLTAALAAGAVHWSAGDTVSLVGRASVTVHPASRLELTAAAERSPYLATTGSLSTPVAPDRAELRITLDRARMQAEAATFLERFPDDNTVFTTYAWALAPLLRGTAGDFRIGYAFALQDAKESRVAAVPTGQPGGGTPEFTVRYAPYHTPQRLVAHSVAGAANVRLSATAGLALNGSWAFRAREDAPVFFADPVTGEPVVTSYRRSFHPLELRAAFNAVLSPRTSAYAGAAHTRTAFYDATRAHAGLLVRFVPRT